MQDIHEKGQLAWSELQRKLEQQLSDAQIEVGGRECMTAVHGCMC